MFDQRREGKLKVIRKSPRRGAFHDVRHQGQHILEAASSVHMPRCLAKLCRELVTLQVP
jgi:hypothetical protein